MSGITQDDILSAKNFALPAQRKLPCDTPAMLKLSAEVFNANHQRMSAAEKREAAKNIVKAAHELGVDLGDNIATMVCGDRLSSSFKQSLWSRRDVPGSEPILAEIEKIAEQIDGDPSSRRDGDLFSLMKFIEMFDYTFGVNKKAKTHPDAVETVFMSEPFNTEKMAFVMVGERKITPADISLLRRRANLGDTLSKEAMDAVKSFDTFAAADHDMKAAIVAHIPREK